MKVIIAGSRSINDIMIIRDAIESVSWDITEIVSGTARGADVLGEQYAFEEILDIKRFPADWEKHGKSAGFIRNEQMAKYADGLIAIWDGKSPGTNHMIHTMFKNQKPVYVHFNK